MNIAYINIRGGFSNKKQEVVNQAKYFKFDFLALSDVGVA